MDSEHSLLVAVPFKKRGKTAIKIGDFIFTLSLDMKWGSPEKVRALLLDAEREGMVRLDGETVTANFQISEIEIPVGFKPASAESIMERAVRLIASRTGMGRKEIVALINERQDSLQRLVDIDATSLLVATEMGIDVRDLAAEAYANLLRS